MNIENLHRVGMYLVNETYEISKMIYAIKVDKYQPATGSKLKNKS